MLMLYNSDNFAVVQFEVEPREGGDALPARGGYEIVDKFARKEIFLEGALAEHFKAGVQALMETQPSEEELDAYIGRFGALAQQPVILH
ncbi:MAG: DUF3567 domain-containing protein [Aquincola sp.]|nr:DUF3567 domain-containing protein [Aquincola sp.]MDH5330188.1 DUF3567 domain-containing protein [Aquincola sp.]